MKSKHGGWRGDRQCTPPETAPDRSCQPGPGSRPSTPLRGPITSGPYGSDPPAASRSGLARALEANSPVSSLQGLPGDPPGPTCPALGSWPQAVSLQARGQPSPALDVVVTAVPVLGRSPTRRSSHTSVAWFTHPYLPKSWCPHQSSGTCRVRVVDRRGHQGEKPELQEGKAGSEPGARWDREETRGPPRKCGAAVSGPCPLSWDGLGWRRPRG